EHPEVPEWVPHPTLPLTVGAILDRDHDLGAALHHSLRRHIRIGHIGREKNWRSTHRFGVVPSPLLDALRQCQSRRAQSELGMIHHTVLISYLGSHRGA